MLRTNFFLKFFKYKKNTNKEIIQYNSNQNFYLEDQIEIKIIEIDRKISESSKALVEAQIVKLRSKFSKSTNFIEHIGKNVYKTKLDESIIWYQKHLKDLYLKRRVLEINLEKHRGIFWLNRIKRILRMIFIGLFIFSGLLIFLSGFMIIIYLMPLIILIVLAYVIVKRGD